MGMWWYVIVILISTSLMAKETEHSFLFIGHLDMLFVMSVQDSCSFFLLVFFFFLFFPLILTWGYIH